MSDAKLARAKELMADALEHPEPEREGFLLGACAGDPELRAMVGELLDAHGRAVRFLAGAPTVAAPAGEGPGTKIGLYKLLQRIGEGGFGSVFMAEQTAPVQRRVALKIIKLGMDTRAVIARFEAERQALAMMDHPNIAKVLDAGATETGRPYFVMELVKGEPVTEYCDKNHVGIGERLDLFGQICSAVQHAHQKGIIHRDIKPSNVLITVHDGKPMPKVIDFGIAKAMHQKLTEKTVFTEFRQLIGTPEYMSPEQAEASATDIDTRSDIYSLGVLLYELLTGVTPFDAQKLRSAAFGELQRIIREEEPPRPSTRLSTLETIASVAAHRQTEPRKLGSVIRGDLDWIVMKCLEKDRTRRYETASGLAADVRRHLEGEPVVAAPPSTSYRLRKLVRRNRGKVVAGVLVLGVLVLGVAGTSVGMVNAVRARGAESKQRLAAEKERDKAGRIAGFMTEIFKGVGPFVALGRDNTMLKEMMDGAAKKISDGDLKGSPEAEATLRATIGETYWNIRALDEAERMVMPLVLEAQAPGAADSPEFASALHCLGRVHQEHGDVAGAEPLLTQAVAMARRIFPGDDDAKLDYLSDLANLIEVKGDLVQAESMHREGLAMAQRMFPTDHAHLADLIGNLGRMLSAKGDLGEGERLLRQSVEMLRRLYPGDYPDKATALHNFGATLRQRGDLTGAESCLREALEMEERLYKDNDDAKAGTQGLLGLVLMDRGDYAGAESLFRRAIDGHRKAAKGDSAQVAFRLCDLAVVRYRQGDSAGAESLYREALDMETRLFTRDHQRTQWCLRDYSNLLYRMGRTAEAAKLDEQGLEVQRRLTPGDSRETVIWIGWLGMYETEAGQSARAAPLLVEGVEMSRRIDKGEASLETALVLHHLADAERALGNFDQAEHMAREAVSLYEAHPGWNTPGETVHAASVLINTMLDSGGAMDLGSVRGLIGIFRQSAAPGSPKVASLVIPACNVLLRMNTVEALKEAEPLLRECLAIREKAAPDAWVVPNTRSMLGGAIVRLAELEGPSGERPDRLKEAEPLLVQGYEGLAAKAAEIPQAVRALRLHEAADRLDRLYTLLDQREPGKGYDAKAAQWKAKVVEYEAADKAGAGAKP